MKKHMFKVTPNLQLFSEKDPSDPVETADPKNDPSKDDPSQKEVTMTQAELDKLIGGGKSKAADKALKDYKNSDEFKAMSEAYESSKTDKQKQDDKLETLSALEKENAELKAKNSLIKNVNFAIKNNMDPDVADVLTEKLSKSVDENKTFEEAFNDFKADEKNAKWFIDNTDNVGNNKNLTTGNRKNSASQVDLEQINKDRATVGLPPVSK